MGRPANPNRRPELLAQILEYVASSSLSRVTFRSLASALGVSTYVLVYHFGSRKELIDAILDESVRMRREALDGLDVASFSREEMLVWMREAFIASLEPRHLPGIRIQFEAGSLERIDPDIGTRITDSYGVWRALFGEWLRRQGVATAEIDRLAVHITNCLFGTQFGYLITGDREATIDVFDIALATTIGQVDAATA
ncbi:TetR/AcrR family transcriptional regulator [Mycetocola tolaasinivorans]|uniref:TetR/AcrR family transcriptional regulator n=1 Tax=Mycetocola tolaasinivorans TaxID=76635 RepID=A0A3L7A6U4_9MICO|nr:TetR family transcriptional regulator [Mycetocola tolaasinivorans]RLP75281.1 TetR/AcrR family transcriptional regulator [Mycetocola tolaasinivorans]